jgi:hypothetical protein
MGFFTKAIGAIAISAAAACSKQMPREEYAKIADSALESIKNRDSIPNAEAEKLIANARLSYIHYSRNQRSGVLIMYDKDEGALIGLKNVSFNDDTDSKLYGTIDLSRAVAVFVKTESGKPLTDPMEVAKKVVDASNRVLINEREKSATR